MKVFWSDEHALHQPEFFVMRGNVQRHHERPERVATLLAAAEQAGLVKAPVSAVTPDERARMATDLARIHDPAMVEFILEGHARFAQLPGAGAEIVPGIRPMPPSDAHPRDPAGLSGRFLGDQASPMGAGTGQAALSGVKVAEAAAAEIAGGARGGLCALPPAGAPRGPGGDRGRVLFQQYRPCGRGAPGPGAPDCGAGYRRPSRERNPGPVLGPE